MDEGDTALGFMSDIFTTSTCFRHSFTVERALMKAAQDKKVTKTHVIECCLLGTYNLNRYIDSFDIEDLNWIHDRQVEALKNKRQRSACRHAEKAHEAIDNALCDELTK